MSLPVPENLKIYHILHMDRLPSIVRDSCLWSDTEVRSRNVEGSDIGMTKIKERRMTISLTSQLGLHVGECVPFYFCPRSVMLYMFSKRNHPEITYDGGQHPIVHLVADFLNVVKWADENNVRWAFTDSNAGSYYFNDYSSVAQLSEINWDAVYAVSWKNVRDEKQAEFLIEKQFPWALIESIGVFSDQQYRQVTALFKGVRHRPDVAVKQDWYY